VGDDSVDAMKTLIFALIGLLGVTLGAPYAEARDKDRDHRRHYSSKHSKHYKYNRHYRSYRSYPRSYYYRSYASPRYYSYPRSYYYGDPYYGSRYYSRRPAITFSFGL